MVKREDIPIFFTIDTKYAPYAACAISSIIENSSKAYNYKIYILHQDLTSKDKNNLKSLQTQNVEITFKEMNEGLEQITDRVENRLRCDYFTLSIYFRLFIPELFKEFDKGIYIDSDIIVTGDISELYKLKLGNNLLGASVDHSIQHVPELIHYVENAVGVPGKEYINSGVLLMNLKEMRNCEFSNKFLNLLTTYHFNSVAPDQDYINAMCNGRILYLDEKWDAMPTEGKEELANPSLIHYNLFQKPWCYDNIQYEDVFWKYAKKSVYYSQIIDYKNNYTEEQMASDKSCMMNLVTTAYSIPEKEEFTFKKIFDKGGNIRV